MTLGAPSGPLDAPLVLVGRDWGFEEAQAGRPFVGAAGHLLDRGLAKARIERGHCLVTNVINERPAGNNWDAHSRSRVVEGLEQLHGLLAQHPRRLVVAFGAEAFMACRGLDPFTRPENEFDGNGITELRGYVFDGPFGPVLASTHPAFILRTWLPWWPCFLWDLQKAKRILDGVGSGAAAGIECIGALRPQGNGPVAVDIETSGPHAEHIECVAFAWSAERGQVVPYEERTRDFVAEVLASPAPKIFHNGQFDVTILERHGLRVENWTDDTMLLWHVVEPLLAGKKKEKGDETVKSLRFLASLLTDEPWWKSYDFQSKEDQLRLCARDARVTWACWKALTQMLDNFDEKEAKSDRPFPAHAHT